MNPIGAVAFSWSALGSAEFWQVLLGDDFNRGYFTALVLVVGFLLVLLVIRIIFALVFRTRSCKFITIAQTNGSFSVAADAITDAARGELRDVTGLEVRRIRLGRRGKTYILTLQCIFEPGVRCAGVAEEIRPKLLEKFKEYFGIESIGEIRVIVEKLSRNRNSKATGDDSASFNFTGL